jgi:glycosyltransferase involved in cell wall biosynthesis
VPDRRGVLAFVPPRYGDDVVGGSEAVLREAARGLAARGWAVEVLTTCARNHYTWENEYPPGPTEDGGVSVTRFPVVRGGGTGAGPPVDRAALERRIAVGPPLLPAEEQAWLNGLFRVPDLFHHLVASAGRYRAVVLSPYLFWTTVAGASVAPERTVVLPCLHDEPYARMALFRSVLPAVASAWYLSEPERDLARRLGLDPGRSAVTGAGVDVPDRYDGDGFRARHGLDRPFVLYAGRREGGKGWDLLVAAWADAVARLGADVDLVTMGVGPVTVPAGLDGRLHDLGFVEAAEAPSAFAAAAAYVQPSVNESFSRTVMEAWLAGTPVLANAGSEVVRWHVERSGAGVTWRDRAELSAAIEAVAASPAALLALAASGRRYVLDHYTWPAVLDRMEAELVRFPVPEAAVPESAGPPVPGAASGRRWFVVTGSYPPEPGPGASAALAAVRDRLAAGDDVTVVSARPTAAHDAAPLAGVPALAALARRVRGADGVWLGLEPGVGVTAGASGGRGRGRALAERAAVAAVLRAARTSVVRVLDVALAPGGRAGRLVLDAAATIVAGSEADRATLVAAGADPAKLTVDPSAGAAAAGAGDLGPRDPGGPAPIPDSAGREGVEAAVRARAAALRDPTVDPAREAPAGPPPSEPLRAIGPLVPAVPSSVAPWRSATQRLVARLTGWQARHVADHVNRLHQATIEAIDRLSGRDRPS